MSGLIVIAAGGTGGHMFPAEALAAELDRRGYQLALVTDSRGGGYGDVLARTRTLKIRAGQVTGQGIVGRLKGLATLGLGTLQARGVLRQLKPSATVGFGGYAAFPTTLAACFSSIPTVIHEQNAVLGRANRLLARRVRFIATAFASIAGLRPVDTTKCVLIGNPVRDPIVALAERAYRRPEAAGPLSVLVLGGSQGAAVFAEVIPAAVALLAPEERARLRISQQCRPENLDDVRAIYQDLGLDVDLASFFDDVPARLEAAHLIICRAGASTVAECTTAGRPMILIPYPWATDDHQTANARAVETAGGGWVMPQTEFTPETLAERLRAMLADPAGLVTAAAAAKAIGQPRAAAKLADLVASLAPSADGTRMEAGS